MWIHIRSHALIRYALYALCFIVIETDTSATTEMIHDYDVVIIRIVMRFIKPPVRLVPLPQLLVRHPTRLTLLIPRGVDTGVDDRARDGRVATHLGEQGQGAV